MLNFIIKLYKNLRLRTQILILNSFLLLLVTSVILLAFYIQFEIFDYISSYSELAILKKTDQNQVLVVSKSISDYMQLKNKKAIHQLTSIQEFFNFYYIHEANISLSRLQQACLPSGQNNSSRLSCPQFCYGINSQKDLKTLPLNNQQISDIQTAASFLDQFGLLFDLSDTKYFQIAAISDLKYYTMYPFGQLIPTYDITSRPWYVNYMKETKNNTQNKLVFTTYYFLLRVNQFDVAGTYSIFNQKQERIAIIKNSLTINNNLLPQVPFNILLVDGKEQVIYNYLEYDQVAKHYFIYNQSFSGFNLSDWQQIANMAQNNNTQNIVLNLFNKYYNQFVNLNSILFKNENFTFILFSNVTSQHILLSQLNQISDQAYKIIIDFVLLQICCYLVIILIEIIIIGCIFKPFDNMSLFVKGHILQLGNNINKEQFKQCNNKSNSFQFLLQKQLINFSKILIRTNIYKNQVLRQFEETEYIEKNKKFHLRKLQKFFKILKNQKQDQMDKIKKKLNWIFLRYCLKLCRHK